MKRVVIIYGSTHHGNTRKLVEAISERYHVTQIDATRCQQGDLTGYDVIGFASGIAFGKFYDPVETFLRENLPERKPVFFLYTCAKTSRRFTRTIRAEALKKGAVCLGEYGCRGYNTYGPWKLLGGMNRDHPDEAELADAVQFFENILEERV